MSTTVSPRRALLAVRLNDANRDEARWLAGTALTCALVVLVAFTLVGDRATALGELPLDDGWIHLVYARGLLRDGLPTYNDGVPEAGFSSLAWLFAELPTSLFSRLFHASPVVASKLTSLLFAALAAYGSGRLVRRLGGGLLLAIATVAAVSFTPGFAFSAVSGMEVTLASAMIVWGWNALLDERAWLAGVCFGLAAITRLEATIVLAIAVVAGGRTIRVGAPGGLMLAVWGLYDLFVTDHPLPNTFYVKASRTFTPANVEYFLRHIVLGNGLACGVLVILLTIAAVARQRKRVVLGLLASALLPCLAIVRTHGFSNATFYTERYFLPFTVLFVPLSMLGVAALPRRVHVIALLALFVSTVPALARARESYQGHCATIRRMNSEPAWWVAAHTPKNAILGVIDAGAIRYLGDRKVIDLGGLNEHHIAHAGDPRLERCVALASNFGWVVLPESFLDALRGGFGIDERARYAVDRWWIVEPPRPATVVVARASVFPPNRDACVRMLKERGLDAP